jgi:hypothetical protein
MADRTGMCSDKTEVHYATYRKKFAEHCGVPFQSGKTLPKEIYSDERISSFIHQEGENCAYMVSIICFSLLYLF